MQTNVPMKEFLLWSNCPNNCKFCWQKKLSKPETYLTEEEKLQAIAAVRNEIAGLPYSDILIVGGEVYCPHSPEVNQALEDLFQVINGRIRAGMTRLMYANTNLIYDDRTVLKSLLDAFKGDEDKLRLTTSYDIYGRYASELDRTKFLNNLRWIANVYPDVHPVVNCILTKQMCHHIVSSKFDIKGFYDANRLVFINFIPYIPVDKDDEMVPTWNEVTKALMYVNDTIPNYLRYYRDQMDFTQNRVLKEYHKGEGLAECTSRYLECGHNENYTRATETGKCFVCLMKKSIAPEFRTIGIENTIRKYMGRNDRKIITVGDVCSYEVWTKYGRPNIVIFDGRCFGDYDVMKVVKESGMKKVCVVNDSEFPTEELERVVTTVIKGNEDTAIVVEGEEDSAIFPCLRNATKGALVIVGIPHDKCMKYITV